MFLDNFSVLKEKLEEAEFVLIGLGEEWQVTVEEMMQDVLFAQGYDKLEQCGMLEQGLPFLMKQYYEQAIPQSLEKAYGNLHDLLEGKNYFIVSMTMDSYLEKFHYDEKRYVNPCGNFTYLQCDLGCDEKLIPAKQLIPDFLQVINSIGSEGKLPEDLVCKECGESMVFNNIYAGKYLEKGYLEQWDIYMRWLQKTVNRKLVILELGVGMQFPTVIRWPFEKTVMYNQKATIFRIHQNLPMLTQEIAKQGYSCQKNSVDVISTCKNESSSL